MSKSADLPANSFISFVGLGYVGLPLAIAFGKKYATIGYDIRREKIENYKKHMDPTNEVSLNDLAERDTLCRKEGFAVRNYFE